MASYERSIKIALDKISGEILDADETFNTKKDAFAVRREYHLENVELYCCECEQRLNVSTSKYDRLHFKHHPNADYCILKDGKLTPEQIEEFTRILKAKESLRHKELKNKIAEKLSKVEDVDISSIAIDNKFIIRGNEKRRPDVYCKYQNKELVFEIQLSDLSLRYILSRYEFYKSHGIYLIWILDKFDVHGQSQMERDIKYLTKYQNFFKLDENSESFKLSCRYKVPFLTQENQLHTKWIDKSVELTEISFDEESYQIFFFNFGDNLLRKEEERQIKAQELREANQKRLEQERISKAKEKSIEIIHEIKELRKINSQEFKSAVSKIKELDEFELKTLNSELKLSKRETPTLSKWIKDAKQDDVKFLDFILGCEEIEIDVSERDKTGVTAFQEIYQNVNISRQVALKGILKRGYKVSEEDIAFVKSIYQNNTDVKNEVLLCSICERLADLRLVEDVFRHFKLVFILESAKRNCIIGFNYQSHEWVAFANNAIAYHSEYWEYIELMFKTTGLWDRLIETDKKGTFQKKVQEFYKRLPKQKFDFDRAFRELYA